MKQTVNLGGETISGFVCNTANRFEVAFVTRPASFTVEFSPAGDSNGTLAYQYAIPSAGEQHTATGSYTVAPPDAAGTRHIDFTVSDHVTFKGFDGTIPSRYGFDLVPSADAPCPRN